MLYQADDLANGGVAGEPVTTPVSEGQTVTTTEQVGEPAPDKLEFTTSALNARLERERRKTENDLLAKLGIESVESLQSLVKLQRESEEAKKSEQEKLQGKLDALQADLEKERLARQTIEKQRLDDKRDSELRSLLGKAHDANKVLALIKLDHAEAVTALLDESGNFDKDKASALITEYQKGNAYLFKDTSPGVPSNNDGRVPEPNKDAKKQLSTMVSKQIRGSF